MKKKTKKNKGWTHRLVPQSEPKGPINEKAFSHERCPDCDIAGRLDLLGRPLPVGATPLRPSRFVWRQNRSAGCETCNGKGRVARPVPIDPMFQRRVD